MELIDIPYSKRQLAQLEMLALNNDFPSETFSLAEEEIMLHIDQEVSEAIPLLTYKGAQIDGVISVPEAFIVRFLLTAVQKDLPTNYYYSTLPLPPLSLPLGYSVNRVYAIRPGYGETVSFFPIKAKRLSYRLYMPLPPGVRYWIQNSTIWFAASDGMDLTAFNVYVEMPTGRTIDMDAPLNMPDDIIKTIFANVYQKLAARYQVPRDNVVDNEPSGNSKQKT